MCLEWAAALRRGPLSPHEELHGIDRLIHLPGVRINLLLHLLLGAPGRLINRTLDCRLSNNNQARLALFERLAELVEVRAWYAALEVADQRSGSCPYQRGGQHSRREDQTQRRANSQPGPAAVLCWLLY